MIFKSKLIILAATRTYATSAFVVVPGKQVSPYFHSAFLAKKQGDGENVEIVQKQTFAKNTLIEFKEKNRNHIGKIVSSIHKSNGNARYDVVDIEGHQFSIADKDVAFAISPPSNPQMTDNVMKEMEDAHDASEKLLQTKLDVSPELLEMAWEEASESDSHELTPKSFILLLHAKTVSSLEAYMTWRLLRLAKAHIFFKELKVDGRVVAFKAKARKSVVAAKENFCRDVEFMDDDSFCFV